MDDFNNSNIIFAAVSSGELDTVIALVNAHGLPRTRARAFTLLLEAVKTNHTDIAKFLIDRGVSVKPAQHHYLVSFNNTPLHFASLHGNLELVGSLLEKKVGVDAKNNCGRTPLHNAIHNQHLDVAKLLLKHGANVYVTDENGLDSLHIAAKVGSLDIVEFLLNHGANVKSCNVGRYKGYLPIHFATEYGQLEMIKLLYSRGGNIGKECSQAPLHIAAQNGSFKIVQFLVENGANVDCLARKHNWTPLHFAIENGNMDVITFLLRKSAMVDVKGFDDATPLHIAAQKGNDVVVQELLMQGASVKSVTLHKKYTPLHFSAELGFDKIVKLLLSAKAEVDNVGKDSATPLHLATKGRHCSVVKLLVQHGAKVDILDKDNKNVFTIALEKKHLDVISEILKSINLTDECFSNCVLTVMYANRQKYQMWDGCDISADTTNMEKTVAFLLTNGAPVNAKDENGSSPLLMAAQMGYTNLCKMLLEFGADANILGVNDVTPLQLSANKNITKMLLENGACVNAAEEDGYTALNFACIYNRPEVAELLLDYGANVNAQRHDKITPLNMAIFNNGDNRMAKLFLKRGAQVNVACENGSTALHDAVERNVELLETLLEYGGDVNVVNKYNDTPFTRAVALILDLDSDDSSYESYDYENDPDDLRCRKSAKVLTRYIVKLKRTNIFVCEENLKAMKNENIIDYVVQCEEEMERLFKNKIKNCNISFFDILYKNVSVLSGYVRNVDLLLAVRNDNFKDMYPIFENEINEKFNKALDRKCLIETGVSIFHLVCLNLPKLDDDIVMIIFSFLHNEELRAVVKTLEKLSI